MTPAKRKERAYRFGAIDTFADRSREEKLVEKFSLTHLSAGELLRQEAKADSPLGLEIAEIMKEGKIVPSEVTVRLLAVRPSRPPLTPDSASRTSAHSLAMPDLPRLHRKR